MTIRSLIVAAIFLLLGASAKAETILLKNGTEIRGKIIERTASEIRVDVGIGVNMTYYMEDIEQIGDKALDQSNTTSEAALSNEAKSGKKIMDANGYGQADIEKFVKETEKNSEFETTDALWVNLGVAFNSNDKEKLKNYVLLLEAVESQYPYNLAAKFGLAYITIMTGDFDRTEKLLQDIKQQKSDYTYLDHMLANLYMRTSRAEVALRLFEEMISSDTPDPAHVQFSNLLNLGVLYVNKNEIEKGISMYLKAQEISPEDFNTYQNLNLAYQLIGKYDKAIEAGQMAVKFGGGSSAHHALGIAYQQNKQYKESIIEFEKAVELNHDFLDAWVKMSYSYIMLDEYSAAEAMLEMTLEIDNHDITALRNYAYCKSKLNKIDEAKQIYRQVLELYPNDEYSMVQLNNLNSQ